MPDIRYVCLSDTHFGAATSLLSNLEIASDTINGLKPSPVLEKLVECLRHLIDQNEDKTKKPTLVLNGDILERINFDSIVVRDGDEIEFLYFMGGGRGSC